jgi:hypothetical protein
MSYIEKDGHAFDDRNICVKCGTSQANYEDNGKRRCTERKSETKAESFSVPD